MSDNRTKLSSSTTVSCYRALESAEDRSALGAFIVERFDERYFRPVEYSGSKHGFTSIAIACLIIETLESFYQGLPDTKGHSKKMFREFFNRDSGLGAFGKDGDWFFTEIRCGILHQAETRGGWRILRSGLLLDINNKTINATSFLRQLRKSVEQYSIGIQTDDALWKKFCAKMNAICANCQ